MNLSLFNSVSSIMTKNTVVVNPNTIMDKVCEIFETNSFHHVPVVNADNQCVGMISKLDYFQLQDEFTHFNVSRSKITNEKFFKSLIASDVMSKNVVSVDVHDPIMKVLDILLENKIHAVVITKNNLYEGLLTSYDFLELLKQSHQQVESQA